MSTELKAMIDSMSIGMLELAIKNANEVAKEYRENEFVCGPMNMLAFDAAN